VEDGADLCLECGEPMGDSPAARVARAERAASALSPPPASSPPPPSPAKPQRPSASTPTRNLRVVKPAAKSEPEPEPRRCPGCGLKTTAARCPSCGTRLRTDDD
jgi:hypothetical protein